MLGLKLIHVSKKAPEKKTIMTRWDDLGDNPLLEPMMTWKIYDNTWPHQAIMS